MEVASKWNMFYVPWPDNSEWRMVRDQIMSSDINEIKEAYEMILMWKLKCPSIPAYIESTYSLLQVMVKEYEMNQSENYSPYDEHDLRLCYSTALIRFVNHISSINSYKGETLYWAAKSHNIPDWIINLRHDAAHSQNLPTLETLHLAAELSIQWLLDNYWSNQDSCVDKYLDVSEVNIDSEPSLEVNANAREFFRRAFELWNLCSKKKREKLSSIGPEFVSQLEEILLLNSMYFSHLENDVTVYLKNFVTDHNQNEKADIDDSKSTYDLKSFKTSFLKFLKNVAKSEESLKQSLVIILVGTSFCSEKEFQPLKWKQVLHLVQEIGQFSLLLKLLFTMAGKGHRGASHWLSFFPPLLKILKKKWKMFKVLKKENNSYKTKVLKKKVHNVYNSKRKCTHIIQLEIFKPPVITLEMINHIIVNPENFSVRVIDQYLKLLNTPLPEPTIRLLKDLLALQKLNEGGKINENASNANETQPTRENGLANGSEDVEDKIYTVEDLEIEMGKRDYTAIEETNLKETGWAKSSIDPHVWNKCPLGLLPFQTKVDCSLPKTLKWKRYVPEWKKNAIPLISHTLKMKKMRQTSAK